MVDWVKVRNLQLEYLADCAPGRGYRLVTRAGKEERWFDSKTTTPEQDRIFEAVVNETWDYANKKASYLLRDVIALRDRTGRKKHLSLERYNHILDEGDLVSLGYIGLREGMQTYRPDDSVRGFFDSRVVFCMQKRGVELAASMVSGAYRTKRRVLDEGPERVRIRPLKDEVSPAMQVIAVNLGVHGSYTDIYDDFDGTRKPLVEVLGEEDKRRDVFALDALMEAMSYLSPVERDTLLRYYFKGETVTEIGKSKERTRAMASLWKLNGERNLRARLESWEISL